uniref:Myelin and lymphocyte protein n=1 Tax=Equus caballus TaxID=9796 RepID=A0A3Q2IEI2_HORSE
MAPGGGRRSRVPVPGRQARCVPSDGSGRRPRHFGGSLGARRAGSDGAGRAAWAPPSWVPGASALNPPRARGDRAAGLREQVSDHRRARALRPVPRPRQHASMDDGPLPSGIKVFTTCPDLLFSLEFVFGGLVWILIASSLVPLPLLQGWVMFVSVFCFVGTTALLFLYLIGAHGGETSWVSLDAAYHSVAALFYLSAAILEALAMILMEDKVTYEHYLENIFAAKQLSPALLLLGPTGPTVFGKLRPVGACPDP